MEKQEFFVSRDVIFCENKFPYASSSQGENGSETPRLWEPISGVDIHEEDDLERLNTRVTEVLGQQENPGPTRDLVRPEARPSKQPVSNLTPTEMATQPSSSETTHTGEETIETPSVPEPILGRGQRKRVPLVTLKNYVTNSAHTRTLTSSGKGQPEMLYPISKYVSYGRFSARHTAFQVSTDKITPPKSYKKAVLDERFRNAMGSEIVALEGSRTWDVVDFPLGKRRLVANGFIQ